jgi:prepilin-type N-terminal cleavage/methylation domain-containing protein/prepilin-type processing-associated H-X9-DG protein
MPRHTVTTRLARHRAARCGFTLVELLVVIGIILVLMTMLLPALTKVRRQMNITRCGSNLHDIGEALMIYAASNGGALPEFNAHPTATDPTPQSGKWLWDVEVGTRDALVSSGAQQKNLYCPVQEDQQNTNVLWDYDDSTPLSISNGSGLLPNPDGSISGFGVMGYFFLILRPDNAYPNVTPSLWSMPSSDPNFTITTWRYQKTIVPSNLGCNPARSNVAAETEIVTDVTADDGNGNFGSVPGGYTLPQQSAHWFGGLPIGGNILFMDGHVASRAFTAASVPGPNADINNPDIMHYRCTGPGSAVRFYF